MSLRQALESSLAFAAQLGLSESEVKGFLGKQRSFQPFLFYTSMFLVGKTNENNGSKSGFASTVRGCGGCPRHRFGTGAS